MHVLWLIGVEVLIKPYFEINFRSGLVNYVSVCAANAWRRRTDERAVKRQNKKRQTDRDV